MISIYVTFGMSVPNVCFSLSYYIHEMCEMKLKKKRNKPSIDESKYWSGTVSWGNCWFHNFSPEWASTLFIAADKGYNKTPQLSVKIKRNVSDINFEEREGIVFSFYPTDNCPRIHTTQSLNVVTDKVKIV